MLQNVSKGVGGDQTLSSKQDDFHFSRKIYFCPKIGEGDNF